MGQIGRVKEWIYGMISEAFTNNMEHYHGHVLGTSNAVRYSGEKVGGRGLSYDNLQVLMNAWKTAHC